MYGKGNYGEKLIKKEKYREKYILNPIACKYLNLCLQMRDNNIVNIGFLINFSKYLLYN